MTQSWVGNIHEPLIWPMFCPNRVRGFCLNLLKFEVSASQKAVYLTWYLLFKSESATWSMRKCGLHGCNGYTGVTETNGALIISHSYALLSTSTVYVYPVEYTSTWRAESPAWGTIGASLQSGSEPAGECNETSCPLPVSLGTRDGIRER